MTPIWLTLLVAVIAVVGPWLAYRASLRSTNAIRLNSIEATRRRTERGHYAVSTAEAIPTQIQPAGDGLAIVPTHPGEAAYERVAEVVGRRGGADAGLLVTDR